MDHFSEPWLALREPHDRIARSAALARAFLRALPPRSRILDLGAGTGANARYLQDVAGRRPRWLLTDAAPDLLAAVHGLHGPLRRHCLDLVRPGWRLDLAGVDGVTASALCDLVSAGWIGKLALEAARRRLPLLFALTVDGRVSWRPSDPADPAVLASLRRDQRRDKGFGRALGPQAPWRVATGLRRLGYRVRLARSDWRIAGTEGALLECMVAGAAAVAERTGAPASADIRDWARRRRRQIAAGTLSLVVGHLDCFAEMPPRTPCPAPRRIRRSPWLNLT